MVFLVGSPAMKTVAERKLVIYLVGLWRPRQAYCGLKTAVPPAGISDPWRLQGSQDSPTALVVIWRSEDRHCRAPASLVVRGPPNS